MIIENISEVVISRRGERDMIGKDKRGALGEPTMV